MITMIAAVSTFDRAIGLHGSIPWHIPAELQYFRGRVADKTVIVGRKTFETLPPAVKYKRAIVLTSNVSWFLTRSGFQQNTQPARTAPEAVSLAETYPEDIFVIGGAEIYRAFMHFADRLEISWIDSPKQSAGDTFFPEIGSEWQLMSRLPSPAGIGPWIATDTYERKLVQS